jgi:hypothetical protein
MNKAPKGTYMKEFHRQAVKLVLNDGLPLPEAGVGCRCHHGHLAIGSGLKVTAS